MSKMPKCSLEFMRFCLVGAVNTGIDLAVFTVLSNLGVLLLVAQCVSYTCGVLNSFLLNRTWTFRGHGQSSGQLVRSLGLNLCTLSVTYGLLVYFRYHLVWPLLVCKLVATGASLGINYLGSRLWIFSPVSHFEIGELMRLQYRLSKLRQSIRSRAGFLKECRLAARKNVKIL